MRPQWRSGHPAARPGMLRLACGADAHRRSDIAMPSLVIPYPAFDPVLIQLGPFADPLVRAGLYLRHPARLGLRARARSATETVGRHGADDRRRLRRFRAVGDARHHPRRPHRLRAVLQSAATSSRTRSRSCNCGRRHVVPRRLHRLRARGRAVRLQARHLRSSRSAISPARSAPIGLFLGRLANFINGELWGRPADVPWAMVFPNGGPLPRHPSQLYEAALEGLVLLACSRFWCAPAH